MKAYGGGFTVVAAATGITVPTVPHHFTPAGRPVWHPGECGCARCWPDPPAPNPPAGGSCGSPAGHPGSVAPQHTPGPQGNGPATCPVCGLSVAADYVARTGATAHRPCLTDPDRMRRPHPTTRRRTRRPAGAARQHGESVVAR